MLLWIPPSPEVCGVFSGFCLCFGYGGVWKNNPGPSVVIGVLTGRWATGSWCLSIYMLPLSFEFLYCNIVSRFTNILYV